MADTKMTKAQKDAEVKARALGMGFSDKLAEADSMQVASGSWLVDVGEVDGVQRYAEIKIVAKAEDFDLDDALTEYADKIKAAADRKAAADKKKAKDKKAREAKAKKDEGSGEAEGE